MSGEGWIRRESVEGVAVLSLGAEVDMSRSPELRTAIQQVFAELKPRRLVIDLAGVEYMDSSGLATLVEAMRTAKASASAIVLCGMQPKVRAIFEIARLHQYFKIVPTRADALSA